ncbi:MAG: hypothetical protein EAX96_10000 [Candidatus Lokiarchaeota archaeon]|nr:hypothetical protein [Candidatus Lokiarchaeota archaeon]
MNEILLYNLMIILAIGIIGTGISINFYFETKRKLFKYCIPGWIIFSLGYLSPIISIFFNNIIVDQILFLFYGIFASIGVYIIAIGTISYFIEVSLKIALIPCYFFICTSIILYLIFGIHSALNLSLIYFGVALTSVYIVPLLKWEESKKIIGKSIRLYFISLAVLTMYFPIAFLIFSEGDSFGLFYSDNPVLIMLNYLCIICGAILVIIYFIHLEFSITNKERFDLKDKYSHNLGNILQTIYLSTGLLKIKGDMDNSETLGLSKIIEKKVNEAEKFLEEIREIK